MTFSFKVGQHYRNRDGEYEVVSLTGNMMKIQYKNGRTVDSDIALQARILERMQEEMGLGGEDVDVADDKSRSSSRNTEEIREFVADVLKGVRQPWTADVTDQVYLNIERRRDRLTYYEKLVKDFGEPTVNSGIGKYVKELTGLKSTARTAIPKSGLIKSYTVLIPKQPDLNSSELDGSELTVESDLQSPRYDPVRAIPQQRASIDLMPIYELL